MKRTRLLLTALFVAVIRLAAVPPAQAASLAATSQTVTITEDQINASYWVTHPVYRSVTIEVMPSRPICE